MGEQRERGALDGILMGTPAVCKDCADIGVFRTVSKMTPPQFGAQNASEEAKKK